MRRSFAAAAAIVVSIAIAAAACATPAKEAAAAAAPDFAITDLEGKTLSLASYRGKVLVLNFWATWCPPCRREIPDFIEAYRELQGEGLEILGVSVDEMTAGALRDWARRTGINYPVALATPEIVRAYEPGDYIPATIVVDRKGFIRHRQSSLMDKATLVRLFRQY
ncbi:MAG TPA: TlpA disulfide reductase family protein [Candidatus Aminicenantes bacterium]|nr:TlpA disulfide reductase family protein [Candidatus Aminicenantes bacterium]